MMMSTVKLMMRHLPIMRIGRECAKQMKIHPVRSRGQQRRAIKRLSGEEEDADDA